MKKVLIVAGIVVASAVIGAGSATIITKNSRKNSQNEPKVIERIVEVGSAGVGSHFTNYQSSEYPDLTYAAENAVQAVVNIEVTQVVQQSQRGFDPFLEFFGFPQGYSQRDAVPRERKSGGSGVIISPDGYIVTNNHVVENASKMRVKLYDGRLLDATLVGTDPTTDVALVKVDGKNLPSLPFGSSDDLRLGEWVLAIGSPFDLQSTITAGIVSAKARNLGAIPNEYRIESFIQTDAAVNPGNSGGALVNTRGELVGINTLIKSATGVYMGYSFAIPSSIVKKVAMDLKEFGLVQRALLGVQYSEITEEFLENFGEEYGIKEKGGVYVRKVVEDGAAEAAGIKEGDIITTVDGITLDNRTNMSEIMSRYRPNDKIKISVKRDGKVKHFDVTLRNKAGKAELLDRGHVDAAESLGGLFAEINDKTKKELKVDYGVRVVEVNSGGILAKARVKQGFIITHINERPIRKVSDLNRITSEITSIDGVYPNGRAVSYSLVQ